MRVKIRSTPATKTTPHKKYLTLSLGKNSTEEERRVLRAMYLSNTSLWQGIGSAPPRKGKLGWMQFNVEYPISDKKFYAKAPQGLASLTAPEVRYAIAADRKKDEEIAYDKAARSNALARELGLYGMVPKDLRPTFECRCGAVFKKNVKLLRHQKFCAVLQASSEVDGLLALVHAQLKGVKKPVKGKKAVESKATSKKEKTSKRKSASTKVRTAKQKRSQTSKASKQKSSARDKRRKR